MSSFIHDDFLLQTEAAKRLYHDYAAEMPILDYHSHLSPQIIAENNCFETPCKAWLVGDHYKWRAMRAAGISEDRITGNASDRDKFQAWAETVPKTLRNPLYHWTHLELRRPFRIDHLLLGPDTAQEAWDLMSEKLASPEFSPLGILEKMNVKTVCTTDDPCDSLKYHAQIEKNAKTPIRVLPTFRPDRFTSIPLIAPNGSRDPVDCILLFNKYLDQLGDTVGFSITKFEKLLEALKLRHDFFHESGCRLSDHGFGQFKYDPKGDTREISVVFDLIRNGNEASPIGLIRFQSKILYEIAKWNRERNWTMQMHIGALRNNSTRAFKTLGPDAGYDSMGDSQSAESLSKFMNSLDMDDKLPKMVLYNLNPVDNDMIASMCGNFQDGSIPGKIQYGSGWWFLDQKDGMERQMNSLSNQGLLSQFIGMLTDSRSFLSFTRHEYFRRILCNLLGEEIETGLLPNDLELIGSMVRNICYNNAERYLDLGEENRQ